MLANVSMFLLFFQGISFKTHLGQHVLKNPMIIESMVDKVGGGWRFPVYGAMITESMVDNVCGCGRVCVWLFPPSPQLW